MTDTNDILKRVEDLYKGLKGKKGKPRWLLSSKFFIAFASIIAVYVLGDRMGNIVWAAATIACVFMICRAYVEVEEAKLAAAREAMLADFAMKDGKITPGEVAALNTLLTG